MVSNIGAVTSSSIDRQKGGKSTNSILRQQEDGFIRIDIKLVREPKSKKGCDRHATTDSESGHAPARANHSATAEIR
jgi:hypothetical protein